jgi:hypothetical protein
MEPRVGEGKMKDNNKNKKEQYIVLSCVVPRKAIPLMYHGTEQQVLLLAPIARVISSPKVMLMSLVRVPNQALIYP